MNRVEHSVVRTASDAPAGVQTIVLEGEFDMANVAQLEHAIDQGIARGACDFITDLSEVEFVDAAAVHALLRGWKRAARRNGRFVLVRPPEHIWRVFVLIGVSRTFATFGSQEEARAYLNASHN